MSQPSTGNANSNATDPAAERRGPDDAAGAGERRGSRLLELVLLILVPLALLAIFHYFAPARSRSEPSPSALAVSFTSGDEAARLGEIRRAVERAPEDWRSAFDYLQKFIITANDAALRERALAWKCALEDTATEREYTVRLRRYHLSREAYEEQFNESLEPGEPDVYLVVQRTRDGNDETVYEGREFALEGWSGEWGSVKPPEGTSRSFTFSWRRGEPIRLRLMERDMAGDDPIAEYVSASGLSIILVSSPRISERGHIVELESDFAFGK